jgi:hypothetical protein
MDAGFMAVCTRRSKARRERTGGLAMTLGMALVRAARNQIFVLLRWDLRCLEQGLRGSVSQTSPRRGGQGPGGPASPRRCMRSGAGARGRLV